MKKHAYICMIKTCIQKYEKNAYKHGYKCMKKLAYICMIKTCIQMYEKNTQTNVWQKHAYIPRRSMAQWVSPCYNWPRLESRTGRPLLCVIPHLSSLFPVSLHCPIIRGIKSPKKRIQIGIQMCERNTHTNV